MGWTSLTQRQCLLIVHDELENLMTTDWEVGTYCDALRLQLPSNQAWYTLGHYSFKLADQYHHPGCTCPNWQMTLGSIVIKEVCSKILSALVRGTCQNRTSYSFQMTFNKHKCHEYILTRTCHTKHTYLHQLVSRWLQHQGPVSWEEMLAWESTWWQVSMCWLLQWLHPCNS